MPDESETARLRRQQADRAQREHELAGQAIQDEEREVHERRSEKAAYLKEKLEEQRRALDE